MVNHSNILIVMSKMTCKNTTADSRTFYTYKDILKNITCSKNATIAFLMKHECIPSTKLCPGRGLEDEPCNHFMELKSCNDRSDGIVWRCRKKHTSQINGKNRLIKNVKVSIRDGTWLQNAKLTLEEIVEFVYFWSNGYSTKQILHELNISEKTASEWSQFMRETCEEAMINNSTQIGGPNIECEIDESKFGKRKYYKGHKVEGQWIFGGREKDDKSKVFMVPVPNRKAETLIPIIEKWIKKGSIIHSDCWTSYAGLQSKGYYHMTVNHSVTFKDPTTGACTNGIECDWRHAKLSLPSNGVKKGYHQAYLAEFM